MLRLRQLGRTSLRYLLAASASLVLALAGYEGFSSSPYQDQAGVWTNGYGNTEHVQKNTRPVSEPEARVVMEEHLQRNATNIDKFLTRPANQSQSDAYQSLAYNIGVPAFSKSSVVRLHNQGDFLKACQAILQWNKITVNGHLTFNQGLANRRRAEYETCIKDLK
jgi:lysozyme